MRYTSILAFVAAAALASTGSATVLPRDTQEHKDPYVGDFRTYSKYGCEALWDQGVGTFTLSMTSRCNAYPESFRSIYVHMRGAWQFRAYKTSDCSDEGTIIWATAPESKALVCNNEATDVDWSAYSVYPSTD
ncbi:hypothetical protein GGR52DRAFT_167906 [Hypoxylon sp. FL1284]|nr:hypothetical protein GGR52DRAFT_167906 [Hypoxylon sp. FL1284]